MIYACMYVCMCIYIYIYMYICIYTCLHTSLWLKASASRYSVCMAVIRRSGMPGTEPSKGPMPCAGPNLRGAEDVCAVHDPEGPSTHYLRTLVPKAI